jgi:hypothetical protein
VLEWNLERYPNGACALARSTHPLICDRFACVPRPLLPPYSATGVFFLFGAGRLALMRSQPTKALDYYARAAQAQSQYRNLHHISWWESAVACLGLWR